MIRNNEASSVVHKPSIGVKREYRLPQTFGLRTLLDQISANKEAKAIIEELKSQISAARETERMAFNIIRIRKKIFADSTIPSMEVVTAYTDILGISVEELVGEHAPAVKEYNEGGVMFRNKYLLNRILNYLSITVVSTDSPFVANRLQLVITDIYKYCEEISNGVFDDTVANYIVEHHRLIS